MEPLLSDGGGAGASPPVRPILRGAAPDSAGVDEGGLRRRLSRRSPATGPCPEVTGHLGLSHLVSGQLPSEVGFHRRRLKREVFGPHPVLLHANSCLWRRLPASPKPPRAGGSGSRGEPGRHPHNPRHTAKVHTRGLLRHPLTINELDAIQTCTCFLEMCKTIRKSGFHGHRRCGLTSTHPA